MTFGVIINVLGIPDFFKFSEWCELGYRSRDSMITMSIIFVILGIALFLSGSVLLIYSIKQFSPARKELLKTQGDDGMRILMKVNKFETGLIMFISLYLLNLVIIYLKESVFN